MNIAKWTAGAALAAGLAVGPALAQEQQGLVNVAVGVEDNVIQVPVAVAANVCGVDVAEIGDVEEGEVVCTIDQQTAAEHNIGRGQEQSQAGGQQDD